jgi:hypothetical protein
MPAVHYYEVEQIRKIKVQANSAADAARLASDKFNEGQDIDEPSEGTVDAWGQTLGKIEIVNLNVTKEL